VTVGVVIAEDNTLLRSGLERVVEHAPELSLLGSAADMPTVLELVERTSPDVVVTDIRMPPTGTDEGIQIASKLRADHPGVGVVVLSQHNDASYALALLDGGSHGRAYLLKERVADIEDLVGAITTVAEGGSVIDPKVVEGLVNVNRAPRRTELDWLTPREREVLGEMAQGKNNAAIAASLVLSERAIEKHTNSIFSKLGLTEERDVNRRVKAVLLYLQGGGG
jgi:DNA-binding NarL/FixJ family response regulator